MELKGFVVSTGYMGYVDGSYILFDTEGEYLQTIREMKETDN